MSATPAVEKSEFLIGVTRLTFDVFKTVEMPFPLYPRVLLGNVYPIIRSKHVNIKCCSNNIVIMS